MKKQKHVSGRKKVCDLTATSLTTAAPVLGRPTLLTVGEIAERLHSFAPNTSSTIERIRHWTREHMLLPVDQHHAGTGKHRRYTEESVYDSAILTVIANAGLPIVTQDYLRSALPLARSALRKWRQARSKNQDLPLFLQVSQGPNETSGRTVSIHEGAVKHDSISELSLTINLSQIFTRVLKEHV
jgi:DNA-binding transcriptional MerR regulator